MTRIRLFCASLALVTVGLGATASLSADGAVTGAGTTTCSGTLGITEFGFLPPTVVRGGASTVHVAARNCTGQSQATELTWLGQFKGKHFAGCPAIDPLAQPATFKAHGAFKAKLTYDLPTSCTASRLQVTVRFTGSGGTQLAEQSADLAITR